MMNKKSRVISAAFFVLKNFAFNFAYSAFKSFVKEPEFPRTIKT